MALSSLALDLCLQIATFPFLRLVGLSVNTHPMNEDCITMNGRRDSLLMYVPISYAMYVICLSFPHQYEKHYFLFASSTFILNCFYETYKITITSYDKTTSVKSMQKHRTHCIHHIAPIRRISAHVTNQIDRTKAAPMVVTMRSIGQPRN